MTKSKLYTQLEDIPTSLILDTLAEGVEQTAQAMASDRTAYSEETIRTQRNLAIQLRLLACEFLDIND